MIKPKLNTIILVVSGLSILLIVISLVFFGKYRIEKVDSSLREKTETEELVKEVGKLILLPIDEIPTIATVSDKEKVKDQVFFLNVENGDKLLAYTRSMQAILYRPSINKIINVAPILIDKSPEAKPSTLQDETEQSNQ